MFTVSFSGRHKVLEAYKPHDYEREMVSHVPFPDLNTVKKDKRMTM